MFFMCHQPLCEGTRLVFDEPDANAFRLIEWKPTTELRGSQCGDVLAAIDGGHFVLVIVAHGHADR